MKAELERKAREKAVKTEGARSEAAKHQNASIDLHAAHPTSTEVLTAGHMTVAIADEGSSTTVTQMGEVPGYTRMGTANGRQKSGYNNMANFCEKALKIWGVSAVD